MYVFITARSAVPLIKLFAWGEGESGGHVLRETTSRGRCGLGCPSRTSERGEREGGTREEPGTLTQGGALFSLDPLVWESNPKLQGGQRRGDVEIKSYLQAPPCVSLRSAK